MLINRVEFLLVNNLLRAHIQDKLEAKRLRELSSLPPDKVVLEIGCGNDTGTKLIKKYFSSREIYAVDLDERMINLAKEGNTDTLIYFEVGDASSLRYKSNQFDAIFDFGIIHHISLWRDCLKELKRVLKPGGELLLEDL